MPTPPKASPAFFDQEQASAYDARFAKLAPMRDALHLLIRIYFADLPDRARVLCVGAGTGAELLALARAFPTFEFTAVEPSGPMLEICRLHAREAGIADRCTFLEGYLHTLPPSEPFHAATSLLVSQFLVHRPDRVAFFAEIARRLVPRGLLVNSDLSADLDSEAADGLKELWGKMLLYSGAPADRAQAYLEAWKQSVGVLPPNQVEEIISSGGFTKPTLIYQNLFIHAWASTEGSLEPS